MKSDRPRKADILPLSFYREETVAVARNLLGCILWRRTEQRFLAARLVEVEAYLGANDTASHARNGLRSARNESMYRAGGCAYVYFTYGMHWCINVVCAEEGTAEAVLLRGAQPLSGIDRMKALRPKAKREYDLMNGPGKLCAALGIDRALDGAPFQGPDLYLTRGDVPVAPDDIAVSARIGVENSGESAGWPLRFFLEGNRYVSAWRASR